MTEIVIYFGTSPRDIIISEMIEKKAIGVLLEIKDKTGLLDM